MASSKSSAVIVDQKKYNSETRTSKTKKATMFNCKSQSTISTKAATKATQPSQRRSVLKFHDRPKTTRVKTPRNLETESQNAPKSVRSSKQIVIKDTLSSRTYNPTQNLIRSSYSSQQQFTKPVHPTIFSKKVKKENRRLEYIPETQRAKENKSKMIKTVKLDKKTL